MAMKYDTMSKRRRGSYDVLAGLDEMHNAEDRIKRQASMICENYLNPDKGEDGDIRRQAIACTEVVTGAVDELHYINGKYAMDENNPATKWFDIRWLDTLDFIPPIIRDLRDSDGKVMSSRTREFKIIENMLVHFDNYLGEPRGEFLNENDVYDDDYIFQRTIRWQDKIYKRVVTNVRTGWSGRVSGVDRDYVLSDSNDKERETSIHPMLPEPEDYDNLLIMRGEPGGVIGGIDALKGLKSLMEKPVELDYLDKLKISLNQYRKHEPMIVFDDFLTEDFANKVMETCPEYLYYPLSDKSFFLLKVTRKRLIRIEPLIKKDYKVPYDKSKDMVKNYVYDDEELKNIYNNFKYKVELKFELASNSPNITLDDEVAVPSSSITDEAYIKACMSPYYMIRNGLNDIRETFRLLDPTTRCEDFDPLAHYDFFYDTVNKLRLINVQQCEKLLEFATNTMVPWLDKRTQVLINSTTDRDNAEVFNRLLQKRLTKGSGSLLTWYQTTLQFDGTYFKYILTDPIVKLYIDKLLVCKVYDNPSDLMFNKQKKPNYIDITEKDPIYSYRTNFEAGDKIYIICDLGEQENVIESITKVKVPSNDFSDVNVSQIKKEGFAGNLQKYVYVTRLILRNSIPLWCNTDDVSDIRVLKILK